MWCWSTSRSPVGLDLQVERAVAREQLEHVIEEPDAGADLVPALALEAERQRDLRFGRPSIDYARGAQDLLDRGDAALRVLDDAGGDAEAAGAARLGRAVAQVDAARRAPWR